LQSSPVELAEVVVLVADDAVLEVLQALREPLPTEALCSGLAPRPGAEVLVAALAAEAVRAAVVVQVQQALLAAGQMFITGSPTDLKTALHPARSRNFILTGGLTGTPTLQPPRLILN
jgi:hypothetical protein